MQHHRFVFDEEAWEERHRVEEEVRKVDSKLSRFSWHKPDRPTDARRGMYWGRRRNWAGRRFSMQGFKSRLADYQSTRERVAFALTLSARRAGRVRMKQADKGAPRRQRDAELIRSHLEEIP